MSVASKPSNFSQIAKFNINTLYETIKNNGTTLSLREILIIDEGELIGKSLESLQNMIIQQLSGKGVNAESKAEELLKEIKNTFPDQEEITITELMTVL